MKFLIIVGLIMIGLAAYLIANDNPSSVIPSPTNVVSPIRQTKSPIDASPSVSSAPTPRARIIHDVAFISQSPFAQWNDPRQQDGCEEASILNAIHWIRGDSFISKEQALEELLALSKFSEERYGTYHDTSAADTIKFFPDYFQHDDVELRSVGTASDIVSEIRNGNLVIVPANGRRLLNPHFTAPGPEYHMLVVKGFDESTKEFITNDPGMSTRGVSYRYSYSVLFDAIADYETGQHIPRVMTNKNMIVVSR